MIICNNEERAAGRAYPRTCRKCGLGPCTTPKAGSPVQPALPYSEADWLRFGGVIEVMIRNPNVDSYVREKEAFIEKLLSVLRKAEAAIENMYEEEDEEMFYCKLEWVLDDIRNVMPGAKKDVDPLKSA